MLFERLLYREMAWAYEAVAWVISRGLWAEWRRVALRYIKGGPILEIGCGPGMLLRGLAQHGMVVAVDASPAMASLAHQRIKGAAASILVVQACVQHLPLTTGSMATVVATFPTGFLRDPLAQKEMERVVRPGGCLLIIDRAELRGRDSLRRFLLWLVDRTRSASLPHWTTTWGSVQWSHQTVLVEDSLVSVWLGRPMGPSFTGDQGARCQTK
jgi:ubiquinone/menaquinone biosynthesis C-methylase UbiE